MDLRRRTTQGLAAAGALLIVAGLSLGSGVALAEPGPAAAGPPEAVQATNTSSDKSSDKPRKKDRKSKKSTDKTSADSTDSNSTDSGSTDSGSTDSGSTDSGSTDSGSTDSGSSGSGSTGSGSYGSGSSGSGSSGSTATTTPPSTASPTTATTRPTTTSAPTTTVTTSASSGGANTANDSSGSADSTPNGSGGTYDGQPITATEDDSTTTTIDDGRGSTPAPARKPAARGGSGSGSDLPPGIYPVDPGPGARTANSPASNATPAPAAVPANPPIVVTETQPAQQTTSSTAAPGTADGNTATSPGGEVRGANQVQEEAPAPARRGRQLGETGDGTRRLILFGGVALLIGAVVVGFTGRDGPILAAAAALPAGPARRRSKPKRRQELDGWEKGIPLAPAKRELARQQLGLSAAVWYYDDEPEV